MEEKEEENKNGKNVVALRRKKKTVIHVQTKRIVVAMQIDVYEFGDVRRL